MSDGVQYDPRYQWDAIHALEERVAELEGQMQPTTDDPAVDAVVDDAAIAAVERQRERDEPRKPRTWWGEITLWPGTFQGPCRVGSLWSEPGGFGSVEVREVLRGADGNEIESEEVRRLREELSERNTGAASLMNDLLAARKDSTRLTAERDVLRGMVKAMQDVDLSAWGYTHGAGSFALSHLSWPMYNSKCAEVCLAAADAARGSDERT